MAMTASEIKNKFIYSLNAFSENIVKKEWEKYKKRFDSDEYKFVNWMMLHRAEILEKYNAVGDDV